MKKILLVVLCAGTLLMESCATVFGGHISNCQRTRPRENSPSRQLRVIALVCDIVLFWPGAIVDFADGAIYRPCTNHQSPIRHENAN